MAERLKRSLCLLLAVISALAGLTLRAFAADAESETSYAAAVYDNTSGMPFSEANVTIQTPDGFIYIGSYGGLTRYDGRSFTAVEGVSSAVCLFVDSRGRLWAGTSEMGAVCLDGDTRTVYRPEEERLSSSVRGFYEYENGDMLMATRTGLYLLDSAGQLRELGDERLKGQYIVFLTGDGQGNVYGVARNEAIFMLRGRELVQWWPLKEAGFDTEVLYPDPERAGFVYFGTEGSELYYGSMDRPMSELVSIPLEGVSGVNCLLQVDGRLWVCAGDGMGTVGPDGTFTRLEHLPVKNAYEHIMEDREGNLWVSSSRRGVMKLYHSIFTDVSAYAGLGDRAVHTVLPAGDRLYIGTDTGLVVTDSTYSVVDDPAAALLGEARVRSILADRRGRLWFSTYSRYGLVCMEPSTGEYRSYTQSDGLPSDSVRDALETADGGLLVSTMGGLARLEQGEVVRTYGEAEGLGSVVLCLCQAADGTVWLGSDGNGVFTLENGVLSRVVSGDVLPGGVILSLKYDAARACVWAITGRYALACIRDGAVQIVDTFPGAETYAGPYYDLFAAEDGKLWLLGGSGVCVVDGDALLRGDASGAVRYGFSSGLTHVVTANSRSCAGADGTAYLAGSDGVTRVELYGAGQSRSQPQLCIPWVEIDGERRWVRDDGRITIPRDARRIRIYAYALTYALDDPAISYRLEGFDSEDSRTTASRLPVVSYTNLPGGSYTFVLSLTGSGPAQGELRLELVKEKRFYEQTAVKIAGGLVLLALVVWLIFSLLKWQRKRLEAKGEEERIGTELRMAANIQAGMLPRRDAVLPGRGEFSLSASMSPAKEVGGDFYDYYLVDDDHLALTVADVGGRGVPAALFMTMTRALLKNTAMHRGSPAQVLREVNARLCEDGGANMLVTVWLAVLELSTGTLTWADAGHERPLICQGGRWRYLEQQDGPALGLKPPEQPTQEKAPAYKDQALRLEPGDALFQYTDGVPEATDAKEQPFGAERLLAVMNETAEREPEALLACVRRQLDSFGKDAPQGDDVTMLALRYDGPTH